MVEPRNSIRKRLMRLGQLLRVFLDKDSVSTNLLCQMFGVNSRTIQRDLKSLKGAGIAVHEEKKGVYRLNKDLFKELVVFDETELALIMALKDLVSQLGKPFEKAAEDLLGRIGDYTEFKPVYVKIDSGIQLNSRTMNRIIKAIQQARQVYFQYQGQPSLTVIANPYRVAYFDGVWYLIARDTKDGIIKKYVLEKMIALKILKTPWQDMPEDIDEILRKSVNIWFSGERTMEVLIEVDATCAEYFRRRQIMPLQEIVEKRKDDTLLIRFTACNNEELSMCLKPWIPHVRIISPQGVRDKFLEEFQQWITWQQLVE